MADSGVVQVLPLAGLPPGSNPSLNQGSLSDLLVSEVVGKYYQLCKAGAVFVGSSAAGGIVPPVSNTTSPTFGLWNPLGSGKNLMMISLAVGWTATTAAVGSLCWSTSTGAGANIGTAAPISAFNAAVPKNGLVGFGGSPSGLFSPAGTNTLTTAAAYYRNCGMSTDAITAASTNTPFYWKEDYDGTFVIPPGVAVWLTCTSALLMTLSPTILWAELPTI